jgi:nitrile hydratase accessory protein
MDAMSVLQCKSEQDWRRLEERGFSTPWSARAFGMVLAAAERKLFTLADFQQALITEIAHYERTEGRIEEDEAYYSRWIDALTTLLMSRSVIDARGLEQAEANVHARLAAIDLEHAHSHEARAYRHDGHGHSHGHGHEHAAEAHARPVPQPIYRERPR